MHRIVLFGASNLTHTFPIAVETARRALGAEELDVLAALGRGRSYGRRSDFLGRVLPGIVDCGLWTALAGRPAAPTHALLTDIGNDIGYEVPVATLIGWLDEGVRRLQACDAEILVTSPPGLLERVPTWQVAIVRRIFFPFSHLTAEQARARVRELNNALAELAARRGVTLVELRDDWYGVDPIHFRVRDSPRIWRSIMASWCDHTQPAPAGFSWRRWLRWSTMGPERQWILGLVEKRRRQPCGSLDDGVRVSLF